MLTCVLDDYAIVPSDGGAWSHEPNDAPSPLRSHPLPHRRGDLSQSAIAREAGTDVSTLEIARNPENYRGRTGAVRRKNTWKIVRVYKRHAEQIEGREIADAEA